MKNPYLNILMQIQQFTQTEQKYEYESIATVIIDKHIPCRTKNVATAFGFLSLHCNYENHVAKILYRNMVSKNTCISRYVIFEEHILCPIVLRDMITWYFLCCMISFFSCNRTLPISKCKTPKIEKCLDTWFALPNDELL